MGSLKQNKWISKILDQWSDWSSTVSCLAWNELKLLGKYYCLLGCDAKISEEPAASFFMVCLKKGYSSEMLVPFCLLTQSNILKDSNPHIHCCEKLGFHRLQNCEHIMWEFNLKVFLGLLNTKHLNGSILDSPHLT